MNNDEKNEEYQLMQSSKKNMTVLDIPNGPTLRLQGWDYKKDFTATSIKTLMKPVSTHSLLKVEEIDLRPIYGNTIYKVIVLRQPESNLKDEKSKH